MNNIECYLQHMRKLFNAQPQPSTLPDWLWLSPAQREQRLRELLQPVAKKRP